MAFGSLLMVVELRTSWLEAHVLSAIDARLTYTLGPGAAPAAFAAPDGPYDEQLGYTALPQMLTRLESAGFVPTDQARVSPWLRRLQSWGIFPVYAEKMQAGLTIRDWTGTILFGRRYPSRIYRRFQDIPPVVLESLLFIENRDLLQPGERFQNPAIQWTRFGHAAVDFGLHLLGWPLAISGGSTLATQLQKFRHSPLGRTVSPWQKLRQMATASLDAYREGPDTSAARRRIALAYVNSLPLGAIAGYGAINGLENGLQAWFGANVDAFNSLLTAPAPRPGDRARWRARGRAYREALMLLLAIRQPTIYLQQPAALNRKVDRYLRFLARNGVISRTLRDAALAVRVTPRRYDQPPSFAFVGHKAADAVRVKLLRRLGVRTLPTLDRMDLSVRTSLDGTANRRVSAALERLTQPGVIARSGLAAPHLLDHGNPSRIIYSFTLYERTPGANLLRVQTDTLDGPLDINQDTRLELGSTAKLRTLITYLQIIAALHARDGAKSPAQLRAIQVDRHDVLSRWALDYLAAAPHASLRAMLQAALQRKYSASPAEAFFTGGGVLHFVNFERSDDHRTVTVSEAFQRSVNLAFVRIMRDVVRYFEFGPGGVSSEILERTTDPRRVGYLRRFADEEGRTFLIRFYQEDHQAAPDTILGSLVRQHHLSPLRAAAAFRAVRPEAGEAQFGAFIGASSGVDTMSRDRIAEAYRAADPTRLGLNDAAFLARIHPLQLWLLGYLRRHPQATLDDVIGASRQARQDAYAWLFKTRDRMAQDARIETVIERDAFRRIGLLWRQLGYPFRSLVPSYATTLGSSGDTPAALAQLAGIILNHGVLLPTTCLERLRFAQGTPFEVSVAHETSVGRRVLPSEIAAAVEREMLGVVQAGTGRRLAQGFDLGNGRILPVGGKTGTGDNRFAVQTPSGPTFLILNRTATFVFVLGDRFFGTVTAFVPGTASARYDFTSALAVQVLRRLQPALAPLLRARSDARHLVDRARLSRYDGEVFPHRSTRSALAGTGAD